MAEIVKDMHSQLSDEANEELSDCSVHASGERPKEEIVIPLSGRRSPHHFPASPTLSDYEFYTPLASYQDHTVTLPPYLTLGLAVDLSLTATPPHSSSESVASSHHSQEEGLHEDNDLVNSSESKRASQHDVSGEMSKPPSSDGSQGAEGVVGDYAGLTKDDFSDVQDKPVSVATAREAPETTSRTGSTMLLRRRKATWAKKGKRKEHQEKDVWAKKARPCW
jgi:hypothetical protein